MSNAILKKNHIDVKIVHKYLSIFLNSIVNVWAPSMYAFFITILAQEFFGRCTGIADNLILKFNFDEFLHKINILYSANILTLLVHCPVKKHPCPFAHCSTRPHALKRICLKCQIYKGHCSQTIKPYPRN